MIEYNALNFTKMNPINQYDSSSWVMLFCRV